ncbi:unnamed protein product [Phytophthora fragariaefolia]|uniref:Unnamed protein product n=1 Tax=Phytophthora fragariaefolia TaxID=1490495 RepID=A0A9W7DBG6_9STRA|nr:unnamed protein product [Phytophthora fragariaefolia]
MCRDRHINPKTHSEGTLVPAASVAADTVVASLATTGRSSASTSVVTSTVTTRSSPKRTMSLGDYKKMRGKTVFARDELETLFNVVSDADTNDGEEEDEEASSSRRGDPSVGSRRPREDDSDASSSKRSRSGSDRPLVDAGPLSSPRSGGDPTPSGVVASRTAPMRHPWMPTPSEIQSRFGSTDAKACSVKMQHVENSLNRTNAYLAKISTGIDCLVKQNAIEPVENKSPLPFKKELVVSATEIRSKHIKKRKAEHSEKTNRKVGENAESASDDEDDDSSRHRKSNPNHFHNGIIRWDTCSATAANRIETIFDEMSPMATPERMPKLNISLNRWQRFFWIPQNKDAPLERWPSMIKAIVEKLPDPKLFSFDTLKGSRFKKFRDGYNKLRSPIMLATVWERKHHIRPNTKQHPAMDAYIKARLSRIHSGAKLGVSTQQRSKNWWI